MIETGACRPFVCALKNPEITMRSILKAAKSVLVYTARSTAMFLVGATVVYTTAVLVAVVVLVVKDPTHGRVRIEGPTMTTTTYVDKDNNGVGVGTAGAADLGADQGPYYPGSPADVITRRSPAATESAPKDDLGDADRANTETARQARRDILRRAAGGF